MKGKGLIAEFKEFILRGNVMDMAVGVIIGGAFKGIIDSLVKDILMPLISLVVGGLDFTAYFLPLDGKSYPSLAAAAEAGAATLNYGSFLTVVLNFLLMAAVIFTLVKTLNRLSALSKKPEAPAPAPPATKTCPYCKTQIDPDASRCPHCTSQLG